MCDSYIALLLYYANFCLLFSFFFFFFNVPATTEIYTLSLHDALPILRELHVLRFIPLIGAGCSWHYHKILPATSFPRSAWERDRKSTRLNSSHVSISYAVFCLKKKIISLRQIISDSLNHSTNHHLLPL